MGFPVYPDTELIREGRLPVFADCNMGFLPQSPFDIPHSQTEYAINWLQEIACSGAYSYSGKVFQCFFGFGLQYGTDAVGDIIEFEGQSGFIPMNPAFGVSCRLPSGWGSYEMLPETPVISPLFSVEVRKVCPPNSSYQFQHPLFDVPECLWTVENRTAFGREFVATAFFECIVNVSIMWRNGVPKGVGSSLSVLSAFIIGKLLLGEDE